MVVFQAEVANLPQWRWLTHAKLAVTRRIFLRAILNDRAVGFKNGSSIHAEQTVAEI